MASSVRKWPGRIGRFVWATLLVILAIAVLGGLVPFIPVLGSLGALLISPFGSWIVLISLVGTLGYGLRWHSHRNRASLVLMLLSGFAAIGAGDIIAQQIAVAHANGIVIDIAQTLWAGTITHSSAQPVVVPYSTDGKAPLRMVVYQPRAVAGKAAPVLVYVHGGGWGGGTIFDRADDMRWFADRGYLVMSVEYTLSSDTRHTWDIAQPQLGCALVWINANVRRFVGDAARLALFGESAGGNLILNVGYQAAANRLQPSCPGMLPRIAALVAPYPVIDAWRMYSNDDFIAGPFARMMTTHYTGGTPAMFPDRYAAISSGTFINPAAPPALLFPGLTDHLLPPDVADRFAARAHIVGITVRLIAFPHGEHSFDQGSGSIGNQLIRQATIRFLAEHGVSP